MTLDIEQLLHDALSARTADVHGRRDSLRELRATVRRPGHRHGSAAVLAVAATVVGVAVVAAAVAESTRERGTQLATPGVSAGPFPADRHYLATAGTDPATYEGQRTVIVRAVDGKLVGELPRDPGGKQLRDPVLAPDGSRVYAVWDDESKLGYLDLRTQELVVLDSRSGRMHGVTVSAGGSTIAYQLVAGPPGAGSHSVIVRDLVTGGTVELDAAPSDSGSILPLALSPDGRTLAVVPTVGSPPTSMDRPLLLVDVADPAGFRSARTVEGSDCGGGRADQPRWTSRALYVYRACTVGEEGAIRSAAILSVDPQAASGTVLQELPTTQFLLYTVMDGLADPLLVTADFAYGWQPGSVTSRALAGGEASTVRDVDGLAITTSSE